MAEKNMVSESRTYVAMCNKSSFDGFHFKKFVLPEGYDNNADMAGWYFLNRLDFDSCLHTCFPAENWELKKQYKVKTDTGNNCSIFAKNKRAAISMAKWMLNILGKENVMIEEEV